MKVLGVLIQKDDGEVELIEPKREYVKYNLDNSGVVDIPTPDAIKEEESIERSREAFGVDDIIKKHNK